jgi:2-polyprenyl-3-methyl-5-hydroxy-6-metoxy-1,4-benzoquinol methylase
MEVSPVAIKSGDVFPTPQFNSLDALQSEIHEMGNHSEEYWSKQVHVVPKSQTVDRTAYLVKHCTGKTVLHIGCTGQLDVELRKVAKKCYGIDQELQGRDDFEQCNLDLLGINPSSLPQFPDVDIVVCGEVLEHLSNPGWFLVRLREEYKAPVIFTVPNAMCTAGADWLMKRGRENVNKDHVCYYSYTTMKELLRRAGYAIERHFWYGGKPYVSEGLIVIARAP